LTKTSTHDVVVIGGGPAGATAARLLASWGWSVALIHKSSSRQSLAESLPPSTRKPLAFLGQLGAIQTAGFHPNTGNVIRWATRSDVTTSTDAGFHVSRARFDEVLRGLARDAGARVIDASVRRVNIDHDPQIAFADTYGHIQTFAASYVLDCTGRAGIVARRGFRRSDLRYRTLAIAAEWQCDDWPAGERTKTVVESYRDGWMWSVPLSDRTRQSTVMIDPVRVQGNAGTAAHDRRVASVGRTLLQSTYLEEIGKARSMSERLARARQISAPWACDASLYHAPRPAEEGVLLVGDAASFIEPLSAAGVKKALTSAWRAAVVTNTCLAKPEMIATALDFHVRRERQVHADCLARSARFFSEASAAYRNEFWSARAVTDEGVADPAAADVSDADLAADGDVRDAFERLRIRPTSRLRPSTDLRVRPVADIEGHEIVMRDALVVPGTESLLRFAAGVNLPALVRLAAECPDVPDLVSAYCTHVGPAPLEGLLTGLSLLVARRALVHEESL
jgi:flavin-dependent dehydrogenase